jgi:transposase
MRSRAGKGLTCFLMTAVSSSTTARRKLHPSIILNRKNALFAGSDGGAEHCAIIALVIETCKLNDVDPFA